MKLDFFAGIEIDDALYFSAYAYNVNGLFKRNCNTGNITYIGHVDNETMNRLHFHVYEYQKKLYFIPGYGECIAILDLKDMSIKSTPLPKREHECQTLKFGQIIPLKNDLWLIPAGYDALVRLDLETEELEVYDNWPEGIMWESENSLQFVSAELISGKICMLPRESKFFVTFDIENKTMQKWDWKYPEFAFNAMVVYKDYIWFLPRKDYPYIVKYSIEKKEEELIELKEEVQEEQLALYGSTVIVDHKIIRAPYQSEYWFILDTNTNQISKKKCVSSSYPLFQKITVLKEGLLATSGRSKKAVYISKDLENMEEVVFDAGEAELSYLQDMLEMLGREETSLKEEEFTMQSYIKAVLSMKQNSEGAERASKGKEIYKKLIE